jgi:hypothetical protein
MDIDRTAPAYAEGSIAVDAPRDAVWNVLTDFTSWPNWSPGVKTMRIDGPVANGARFRWKSGPGTIKSRIEQLDAPRAVAWSGTTVGIKAQHAWELDEVDGRTTVTTRESWRGLVVRLLHRSLQPTLQQAIDDGLVALKAETERRQT